MTSKIDQNSIKNRSKKRFEKCSDFGRKDEPKATPKWAQKLHLEWPKRLNNYGQLLPVSPLLFPTCCKRVPPMSCHTVGGTPFVPSPTFRSARRPLPLRHKNNAKTRGFSASVASCAPTIIHNGLSKKAGGGGDSP